MHNAPVPLLVFFLSRPCGDGVRLIRKEYFCDKRINCAQDFDPADERPSVCRHLLHNEGFPTDDTELAPAWQPHLNLVSITLILVSFFVILVLVLLLLVRMRRSRCCCFSVLRGMESCELPERSVVMQQARGTPAAPGSGALLLAANHSGGGDRVENVYTPLARHMESGHLHRRTGFTAAAEEDRGTTPDTEPPPAYHDLFPVGYKFSPEKIAEERSLGLVPVLAGLKEATAVIEGDRSITATLLPETEPEGVAGAGLSLADGGVLPEDGIVSQAIPANETIRHGSSSTSP